MIKSISKVCVCVCVCITNSGCYHLELKTYFFFVFKKADHNHFVVVFQQLYGVSHVGKKSISCHHLLTIFFIMFIGIFFTKKSTLLMGGSKFFLSKPKMLGPGSYVCFSSIRKCPNFDVVLLIKRRRSFFSSSQFFNDFFC